MERPRRSPPPPGADWRTWVWLCAFCKFCHPKDLPRHHYMRACVIMDRVLRKDEAAIAFLRSAGEWNPGPHAVPAAEYERVGFLADGKYGPCPLQDGAVHSRLLRFRDTGNRHECCRKCCVVLAGRAHPKYVASALSQRDDETSGMGLGTVAAPLVVAPRALPAVVADPVPASQPTALPAPPSSAPSPVPSPVRASALPVAREPAVLVPPPAGPPAPGSSDPPPSKAGSEPPKPPVFSLEGRFIQAEELEPFVAYCGGQEGVSDVVTFKHEADRRIVTNRNVKETTQDIVVQRIRYCVRSFTPLAWILASVACLCALCDVYVNRWSFWMIPPAIAPFAVYLSMPRLLLRRRGVVDALREGKFAMPWRYILGLGLGSCVQLVPDLLGPLPTAVVLLSLLAAAIVRNARRWRKSATTTIAVFVLCPLVGLLPMIFADAYRFLPGLVMSELLQVLLWRVGRVLPLTTAETKTVLNCPHAAACVLAEFEHKADAVTVRTNTRAKLLRLATLPVPDMMHNALANGTEQVVYFLAESSSFFAEGATYGTWPLRTNSGPDGTRFTPSAHEPGRCPLTGPMTPLAAVVQ